MLCGYGGAVSDAIIISCKEEIICQQEAEKLFGQQKGSRWGWKRPQCTAQQFMKCHSCREASCRGAYLNQMALVPKWKEEREGGEKNKAGTYPRTQHQLATSKTVRTQTKAFWQYIVLWQYILLWCTICREERKSKRDKERDRKNLLSLQPQILWLGYNHTGRLLKPSNCCLHATTIVELFITSCCVWTEVRLMSQKDCVVCQTMTRSGEDLP